MLEGGITLSHKELDRLSLIKVVTQGYITQLQAAEQLKLSTRQIKRLVRKYRHEGDRGLISKRRGKPSNNRISAKTRQQSLRLIRTRYKDFGPTFAHQKLTEEHQLTLSVETLRQWMINDGLWQGQGRKKAKIHQERQRRSKVGELIQIDGSPPTGDCKLDCVSAYH